MGKPKRLCKFNKEWTKTWSFILGSRKGENSAFCEKCRCDISIGHGGLHDIKKHVASEKHRLTSSSIASTSSVLSCFASSHLTAQLDQQVANAETLFTGFLIEHNLPLSAADHASKLFKQMFPDSKVAKKYSAGRAKTSYFLNGAIPAGTLWLD